MLRVDEIGNGDCCLMFIKRRSARFGCLRRVVVPMQLNLRANSFEMNIMNILE
jgi:hypothetical protein